MNGIAKLIKYNLKKHYKLEIITAVLCLAFYIMVLGLMATNSELVFLQKYKADKYLRLSVAYRNGANEMYDDFNIEDKKIGSYFATTSNQAEIEFAIMDKSFFDAFDYDYERKTAKHFDYELIVAAAFKDDYPVESEHDVRVGADTVKGVVVGYTYEKFLINPPYAGLGGLWTTDIPYMVVVSDMSLVEMHGITTGIFSLYDLTAEEYKGIKDGLDETVKTKYYENFLDNPFLIVGQQAANATNGAITTCLVYGVVIIVFAAVIIYSVNFLTYRERMKQETAILNLVGVSKRNMIIANAVICAVGAAVTTAIYALFYNVAVKSRMMYGNSFAYGLIGFIVLGYAGMFAYRTLAVWRNKIPSDLYIGGN